MRGSVDTIGRALMFVAERIEWAHQSMGVSRSISSVGPWVLVPRMSSGPSRGGEWVGGYYRSGLVVRCRKYGMGPPEYEGLGRYHWSGPVVRYRKYRMGPPEYGRVAVDIIGWALGICAENAEWALQRAGKGRSIPLVRPYCSLPKVSNGPTKV